MENKRFRTVPGLAQPKIAESFRIGSLIKIDYKEQWTLQWWLELVNNPSVPNRARKTHSLFNISFPWLCSANLWPALVVVRHTIFVNRLISVVHAVFFLQNTKIKQFNRFKLYIICNFVKYLWDWHNQKIVNIPNV